MDRRFTMMISGAAMLGVVACSDGRAPSPKPEPRAQAESAYPPAPKSSPMARVQEGMSERDVAAILGAPDDSKAYITGKAFIPFYFGPDQTRFACYYRGKGRVIFEGGNQWGAGRGRVVRVEYDPSEDGLATTK